MSNGFKQLTIALQGDFTLVADFLENPSEIISHYNLTDEERDAMLSRDFDKLAALCGSQQMAAGVLSGAHTPSCSNKTSTRIL